MLKSKREDAVAYSTEDNLVGKGANDDTAIDHPLADKTVSITNSWGDEN